MKIAADKLVPDFFPKTQIESTVRNFMPFAFIVFKRRELPKMH